MMDSHHQTSDLATNNPYAAPQSELHFEPSATLALASRWHRLLAVLVDGVLFTPFFFVFFFYIFQALNADQLGDTHFRLVKSNGIDAPTVIGFIYLLCLIIVQLVFLARHGQTIGKRLLKIRVVRNSDDSQCGLGRYFWLRSVVPWLIGVIPFVGNFFPLVDALFIFRNDKRCLHDMIADTKVVVA